MIGERGDLEYATFDKDTQKKLGILQNILQNKKFETKINIKLILEVEGHDVIPNFREFQLAVPYKSYKKIPDDTKVTLIAELRRMLQEFPIKEKSFIPDKFDEVSEEIRLKNARIKAKERRMEKGGRD